MMLVVRYEDIKALADVIFGDNVGYDRHVSRVSSKDLTTHTHSLVFTS
jgi:hypothetical protein